MTAPPSWVEAVEADVRFALVESAARRAGSDWAAWHRQLCKDGFDDVDIRSLPQGQPPLAAHTHPYDLRVLVLAGGITLSLQGEPLLRVHGDGFELPAHTVHAEAFGPDGYTYLAARRHAVPGPRGLPSPSRSTHQRKA